MRGKRRGGQTHIAGVPTDPSCVSLPLSLVGTVARGVLVGKRMSWAGVGGERNAMVARRAPKMASTENEDVREGS